MANQPEVTNYDAGVYQLQTTDPVQGGLGGVSNAPLLNLANRTNWLYTNLNTILNGTVIPSTYAPINSPQFTGSPIAPTPAAGDSSTKLATTAFVQGIIGGLLALSVAGNTNVTLSAAQAGNGILNFTGALTGNIAVIVPNTSGKWVVENNTSGAYTLTVKTAAGSGVAVSQGKTQEVFCDGASVWLTSSDFVNMALTGSPTAPTPAQFSNGPYVANTAFVQESLGNFSGIYLANAGSVTLPSNVYGNAVQVGASAGATLTLPGAGNAGATIWFYHQGVNATTIAAPSGGFIYAPAAGDGSSNPSITLKPGDTVQLTNRGGTEWDVTGGTWAVTNGSVVFSGTQTTLTQAQFNNSTALATTAFVQRALGNYSNVYAYTTSQTLTASQAGALVDFWGTSAATYTLPAAASVPLGATFTFVNTGSAPLTIQCAGSDGILELTGATAVLNAGDTLEIASDQGTQWFAVGGSIQLPYSAAAKGAGFTTQAQFDNSTKLATTNFVQRALGNFQSGQQINANATLVAANCGNAYQFAGGYTVTLPAISTMPSGGSFVFSNNTGAVATVNTNGSDTFAPGGLSTISFTTDNLWVVAVGGVWLMFGGSAALPFAASMAGANWTTAPQFDSSKKLATTAFVQTALGNYQSRQFITGATTYTNASSGSWIDCGGTTAYTVTLPAPTTPNIVLTLSNVTTNASVVTLSTPSANIYNQGNPATTFALSASDTVKLASDGSNWTVLEYYTKSPNFSGTPTATTQASGTNNTALATTAFVNNIFASPPAIGATTRSSGNFTSIAANAGASVSGGLTLTGGASVDTLTVSSVAQVPTVSLGDNTTKVATTAFVQRAIGGFSNYGAFNSSTTFSNAQANWAIQSYGGAITFTLPVGSTMPSGATMTFYNQGAGVLNIATQGSDVIYVGANVQPVAMQIGDTLVLMSRGSTEWDVVGGSAALQFVTGPRISTPAQFDNSTKIASTAFVQRALGNANSATFLSANTTLSASQVGGYFNIYSGANITIPSSSAVPAGSMLSFWCSSGGNSSLIASGSDKLYANASGAASLTMTNGDAATLVCQGSGLGWAVVSGSIALGYSGLFGSSLAANGYQKLPSGLIIQWGTAVSNSSGVATLTLPITFPTALLSANCNYVLSGTALGVAAQMSSSSTRSALYGNAFTTSSGAAISSANVWFIAIGY
ncbi:hypothetical protein PQR39_35120 [Paraburkholderia sediminicola]|uniref:beta strand repeat-containing protein n=1 Tax=Paraburkholderia sediminicola TaxID=458836 RepID=UPI0038BC24BF